MASFPRAITYILLGIGVLLVFAVTPVKAQTRLEGLDRLYFERINQPDIQKQSSQQIPPLLPKTLSKPERTNKGSKGSPSNDSFSVKDFIVLRLNAKPLWIREVVDTSHPRIHELWWALYDRGVRSDAWYFTAIPRRNDNKMLCNYQLVSILSPAKDVVIFRVRGSMDRPEGAWWTTGIELVFNLNEQGIILNRVRNSFEFYQWYDAIDINVSVEKEIRGRFERRSAKSVSDKKAAACGFLDPIKYNGKFSWTKLEKAASCISNQPKAVVSYRDRLAPSFIERGGE